MVLKNRVPRGQKPFRQRPWRHAGEALPKQRATRSTPPTQQSSPQLGHCTHHFFSTILFQRVPVWAAMSFLRSPMVSSVLGAEELRKMERGGRHCRAERALPGPHSPPLPRLTKITLKHTLRCLMPSTPRTTASWPPVDTCTSRGPSSPDGRCKPPRSSCRELHGAGVGRQRSQEVKGLPDPKTSGY